MPTVSIPSTSPAAVDTIEDLLEIEGQVGQVIVANGYEAAGDGSGGPITWDPDSTASHDGGITFKPEAVATTAPGRWRRNYFRGPIDLGWFNVKGDGSADIHAALTKAVEAAAFYSTAKKPATVFIPNGTYALEGTFTYVGRGEAFNLIGEQGGQLAWGGTQIKWEGGAGGTMFDLSAVWRGVMENIDWNGQCAAGLIAWLHSNQPAGGAGLQGYLIRKCGFYDVDGQLADPLLIKVGHPTGGTYQVDLTTFEDCNFRGDYRAAGNVTGWRQEQGGNTCGFNFLRSNFYSCRFGIDARSSSNWVGIDNCFFAGIGSTTPAVSASAACIVAGGEARIEVTGGGAQNSEVARYVTCPSMGGTAGPGLSIRGVYTYMEPTVDNVLISYPGQLTLDGNSHKGVSTSPVFKVVGGASLLGPTIAGGSPPSSILSRNCNYGNLVEGSYAPFFDGQGNPLTGPDSYGPSGFYGYQRCAVSSVGDMASSDVGGAHTVALEPWDGTIAHQAVAWNPGNLVDGATEIVTMTWAVAGVLAYAPVVGVTFSQLLPAGMRLSCGRSGTNEVWAMLENHTGGAVNLAAGTLTFSARAA